jgi:microcystin-dependent protein
MAENTLTLYVDNLPVGAIIMFNGKADKLPQGWAICDGDNGTPNLISRFIVGAKQNADSEDYRLGEIGGKIFVTLNTKEIPSHNHTGTTAKAGSHDHAGYAKQDGSHTHDIRRYAFSNSSKDHLSWGGPKEIIDDWAGNAVTESGGTHGHDLIINNNGEHDHTLTISNAGGGESHENRPPFYALYFIMKIV